MISSRYAPDEAIMVHQPLGLTSIGSIFIAQAPWKACRLCGALFQGPHDLEQYEVWQRNDGFPANEVWDIDEYALYKRLEATAVIKREDWLRKHNHLKHSNRVKYEAAVQHLERTGAAVTAEAAFNLAPYGIFPLGNKSAEIVDAMATAPRAPLNDPEG